MTEEIQYDVFLSHNSQDKPAVERQAHRLADEAACSPFQMNGISSFFPGSGPIFRRSKQVVS